MKDFNICWFRILKDSIWVFDTYEDAKKMQDNFEELDTRLKKIEDMIGKIEFLKENLKKENNL